MTKSELRENIKLRYSMVLHEKEMLAPFKSESERNMREYKMLCYIAHCILDELTDMRHTSANNITRHSFRVENGHYYLYILQKHEEF